MLILVVFPNILPKYSIMPLPTGSKTFRCAPVNTQYTLTNEQEFAYAQYGTIIQLSGFQFGQKAVDDSSEASVAAWFSEASAVIDAATTESYLKIVDSETAAIASVLKIKNVSTLVPDRDTVVPLNPAFVGGYNASGYLNYNYQNPTAGGVGSSVPAAPRTSIETGNLTSLTAPSTSDNSTGELIHGNLNFTSNKNYTFSWHATNPSPPPAWTASFIAMYSEGPTYLSWKFSSNVDLFNPSPTVVVRNNADNSIMANVGYDNLDPGEFMVGLQQLTPATAYSITVTLDGYTGSLVLNAITASAPTMTVPTFTASAISESSADVVIDSIVTPVGYTLLGFEVGSKLVTQGVVDSTSYTFGSLITRGFPTTAVSISSLDANKTYAFVVRAKYGPTNAYSSNATVQYVYTAGSIASVPLSDVLASSLPGQSLTGGTPAATQLIKDMLSSKAKAAPGGVFELVADTAGANPTPTDFISAMGKIGVLIASDYSQSYLSSPPLTAGGAVSGDAVVRPDMMNTSAGAALLYAAKLGATYKLRSGTGLTGQNVGKLVVDSTGGLSAFDAADQPIAGVTTAGVTTFTVGERTYTAVATGSLYIKVTGRVGSSGVTSTTTSLALTIAEQGSNATPANGSVTTWASLATGSSSGAAGTASSYNNGVVSFSGLVGGTKYYVNIKTTGSGSIVDQELYTAPAVIAVPKDEETISLQWPTFVGGTSPYTYSVQITPSGAVSQTPTFGPTTTNGAYTSIDVDTKAGNTMQPYACVVTITDGNGDVYTCDSVSAAPAFGISMPNVPSTLPSGSSLTIPTGAGGISSTNRLVGAVSKVSRNDAIARLMNQTVRTVSDTASISIPSNTADGDNVHLALATVTAAGQINSAVQTSTITIGSAKPVLNIAVQHVNGSIGGTPTIALVNVPSGIASYQWEMSNFASGAWDSTWIPIAGAMNISYTINTSTSANVFEVRYRLTATANAGVTAPDPSNICYIVKLNTPTIVSATPGDGSINVVWTPPAKTAVHANVAPASVIKYNLQTFTVGTTQNTSVDNKTNIAGAASGSNLTQTVSGLITANNPHKIDLQSFISSTSTIAFVSSEFATRSSLSVTAPSAAICFLADAPVLTPAGYRPISSIKEGDKVRTAAGLTVAVKRVFAKEYQAGASVNPFVIPKGSFGALRALPISPNHEVMTAKGMMKAKDLGLPRMKMAGSFTYYNLELEDWVRDNLVVAGVECESLAPAARVSMTKAEFGKFVKARYGPAAAARLRTVCFEEANGSVSMPKF